MRPILDRMLHGRGDSRYEWAEVGERALHLRRRLSHHEQKRIGPAMDIRGTAEAERRFATMVAVLPDFMVQTSYDEMHR